MIRVKICGITRKEDALLAENAEVWAIGFIFVPATPRYITPENAGEITKSLSGKIEKVGVFVNFSCEEIVRISEVAGITKIQLHGEETPEFCAKINKLTGKEVIKAIRIKDEGALKAINSYKGSVSYILLDTYSEKFQGGTGETFNWEIAQKAQNYDLPIILAGGLNPYNLITAYEKVKPFALDLSSGVEKTKGIKDLNKIKQLKEIIKQRREGNIFKT